MEIFSGLLLTAVVLGIVVVLAREVVGERSRAAFQKVSPEVAVDATSSMIGGVGQVIESREGADHMKIRVAGERWSANLVDGRGLPVGTEVRVVAVNGLVLDVEECAAGGADAASE